MAVSAFKKAIIFSVLTWLTFNICIKAQETLPSYLMPGTAQQSLFNPAYQNKSGKLIIGIPLLSGIEASSNTSVTFNSIFSEGFKYSFKKLYNDLGDQGEAQIFANASMFFASLKHNNYTYSLSISERVFSELIFDKEIIKLIRDGTQKYYGTNENFGGVSFRLQQFREIAPGISKRINQNLDIGIRLKILFGKLYLNTKNIYLSAETDPQNNELLIKSQGSYKLSGPFSYNSDSENSLSTFSTKIYPGDYFFQPRNLGFALDAGIIFRPSDITELSVSLNDIGFTGFKYNSYRVQFTRPLRYTEYSLYQSHSPEEVNYREPLEALRAYSDSLINITDVNESPDRFISYLPIKINISGKYQFSEKYFGGIINQFYFMNKKLANLFSAFIYTSSVKNFEFGTGVSVYNLRCLKPGLGISYSRKKYQIFFTSNNIWGIINPTGSKHLNLYFGINLLFDINREEIE